MVKINTKPNDKKPIGIFISIPIHSIYYSKTFVNVIIVVFVHKFTLKSHLKKNLIIQIKFFDKKTHIKRINKQTNKIV